MASDQNQNNLTDTSSEKIWDLSPMPLVDKTEQIGVKIKNNFPLLKLINFTVIIVVRYQLKPVKKFIFIYIGSN